MSAFWKLAWVDSKMFLRNYVGAFFMFVFPGMMMALFGAMYGNQPTDFFGGFGAMDVTAPGYIAALVVGTAAFMNLPAELANYRQQGILRRYRATPMRPVWVLGSQMVVTFGAALLGTVILVGVGLALYHLRLPHHPLQVFLGFVVTCLTLFPVGFLLASLMHTASAARAVGMVLYYPMLFLSGGTLPREAMPAAIQRVGDFLPLTYAVNLLKDLWFDRGWNLPALGVMLVVMLVCVVVSVKFFRWE